VGRLTRIEIFPVKGMRALGLESIGVDLCGLTGDPRWMVVDESGRFHTQRDLPVLATIDAEPRAAGLLVSAREGERRVEGVARRGLRMPVPPRVPGRSHPPRDQPGAQPPRRPGELRRRLPGLDRQPRLLRRSPRADAAPLEVRRFRANRQVSGFAAHADDRWRRVRVGGVTFRVAKPIDRCVVTALDPRTGEASKGPLAGEPLRTLAAYRRWNGSVFFASHLVPEAVGADSTVAVGDDVEAIEEGPLWH
jgi:uncharacterized protein YcbX